jgi:hypothetical protein
MCHFHHASYTYIKCGAHNGATTTTIITSIIDWPQIFYPLSLLVFQPNDAMLEQLEAFERTHRWGKSYVISLQV